MWEMHSVWPEDTCVKLTAQNKPKMMECSTKLPVVCMSDLEELHEQGDVFSSVSSFLIFFV